MMFGGSKKLKRKLIDIAEREGMKESAKKRIEDMGLQYEDGILEDIMSARAVSFLVNEYESRNGVEL